MEETFIRGFLIGVIVMFGFKRAEMNLYKNILVDKAKAPSRGQSNVEFIHGKPYVIMSEGDYIKNCKLWYEDDLK